MKLSTGGLHPPVIVKKGGTGVPQSELCNTEGPGIFSCFDRRQSGLRWTEAFVFLTMSRVSGSSTVTI